MGGAGTLWQPTRASSRATSRCQASAASRFAAKPLDSLAQVLSTFCSLHVLEFLHDVRGCRLCGRLDAACTPKLHRFAGAIGTAAARIWKGFGTRVLANDIRKNPLLDGVVEYVELDELLKESHLVSLHCPLLPSTFHLLNAERCACHDFWSGHGRKMLEDGKQFIMIC